MVSPAQTEESPTLAQEEETGPVGELPGSDKIRKPGTRKLQYGVYVDLGYLANFNQPENGLWRSKSTTFEVDDPRLNMALAYVHKDATPQSRWGLEFALQTGVDTDGLIPDPPPEPISYADVFRHMARANASYLFPVGNGLKFTGGLINSYIAYESYFALKNVNYTRGYITDNVPYFFFGLEGSYPINESLNLSFNVVNNWDYLLNPNDRPSYGLQVAWDVSPNTTFTQNLFYGPNQEDTSLEFWRFFSDSILEWKKDPFLLAVSFDIGTEKQAEQMGNPRNYWMAAALWAAWSITEPLTLAFRPEFFYDPDGLITGARQTLQAYTLTLKYEFTPAVSHTLAAALEYRYDRSTGPDGGFFKGADNRLVPDQHLLIFALMWHFGKR
jgi:hypothetical protein